MSRDDDDPGERVRMKEKTVKDYVRKRLRELGAYQAWPVPTVFGTTTVDCLACYRGVFFGIECKAPNGKVSPRQHLTMEEIKKAGGGSFAVFNKEDVDTFLNRETMDNYVMSTGAMIVGHQTFRLFISWQKQKVYLGRSVMTPESICRGCGKQFDGATGIAFKRGLGPAPNAGDISICIQCGTLAIWDDDMRLRPPSEEENKQIEASESFQLARKIIAQRIKP